MPAACSICAPRLPLEGHGTGDTPAAAIATGLAQGRSPRSAVRRAVT
ncbi:MAG: hydroxymethylpyrimidine/phosphomethylpyrimidine kinase [Rhodanobacter sp.]|nr:hydroxymethylpyrimidine/phosphomethylpyrimidine kinase [Rhodanobacter sp.]